MDVTPYIEALLADLRAAVDPEDDQAAAVATRLARALEASARLQLQDALAVAALELSTLLPAGHVEIRLAGRDLSFVLAGEQPAEAETVGAGEEGTARITLRLPESLKARAEEAATREGVSMNTWLARAVARALDIPPRLRQTGRRVRGFAES